jgi:hypothetical protein
MKQSRIGALNLDCFAALAMTETTINSSTDRRQSAR